MANPGDGIIRITSDDTSAPAVDEVLAAQQWAAGAFPGPDGSTAWRRVGSGRTSPLHMSMLTMALAGAVGAFLGWAVLEPFYSDEGESLLMRLGLPVICVWAAIGLFVGLADALVSRNFARAALGGGVGLLIGLVGGAVVYWIANVVFGSAVRVAVLALRPDRPTTSILIAISMARAIAWAVAGTTAGIGPGIALRSGKLVVNGLLGGVVGAFIGGLVFDPIALAVGGTEGAVSRGVGFTVTGLAVGLMIGLVGELAKEAWIRVLTGPLAGKQFVVYRNPTYLGSSPKCEIYLFKDPDVEPQHAAIHQVQRTYEVEDLRSRTGTYVNGRPVAGRQRLLDGDQIQIGSTVFDYSERRTGGASQQ